MKSLKNTLALSIVLLGLGYGIGRYLQPANVVKTEKIKHDIHTIVREVTHPDGTKETTTETSDKSTSDTSLQVAALKPQWKVGGSVGIDKNVQTIYGVQIERRILGPIFVGGYAKTNKEVGLSLSYEF